MSGIDGNDRVVDEISRTELEAFFPDSKYPEKFLAHKRKETRFAGFNFWAAIFSTPWFFYRRLYAQGLASWIFEIVIPATIVLLAFPISAPSNEFSFLLVFSISFVGARIAIGYEV